VAVSPNRRGGQPQPPAGLELSGELENGCRKEMDFVVNHEPPVFGIQHAQMSKLTFPFCGHDAVAGDRDGFDLFD